jgi:SRSO17 transposase
VDFSAHDTASCDTFDDPRSELAGVSQGFLPRLPIGSRSGLPHRSPGGRRTQGLPAEFADYCRRVLGSVPRADQRRWGELYVRGLLTVQGRKTITRLVAPPADQSLQQFVNQSPWDWRTVRRDLAQAVEQAVGPQALIVQPVHFPKSGDRSVGVDRQYVPSLRRMVNCQAAVSAWLAGPEVSCPVDWNLVLTPRWLEDPRLRSRAGIPADAVARRPWEFITDLLAGLPERLGVPQWPVVLDLRHGSPLRILDMLRAWRIPHIARVDATTLVRLAAPLGRGLVGARRALSVAGIVAAVGTRPEPVSWRGPDQQRQVSKVTAVQVVLARRQHGGTARPEQPMMLLAERSRADRHPHSFTLTDMVDVSVAELIALGKLALRVNTDLDRLVDERGLTDFEGRSYRGWHHHVTLVSVAQGYEATRAASSRRLKLT